MIGITLTGTYNDRHNGNKMVIGITGTKNTGATSKYLVQNTCYVTVVGLGGEHVIVLF